jgi:clan AA aspartic protease (TIGR02281 family)
MKASSPLVIEVDLWNKRKSRYSLFSILVDTGAHMTCIDKNTLIRAGYDVESGNKRKITTASGTEYVTEVYIDRIKLGNIELEKVLVYAHEFPEECYMYGVLGLNILSKFDISLLFSERLIKFTSIKFQ